MTQTLLRRSLLANAAFSMVTGAALVAASAELARSLAVAQPWIITAIGASLLGFAALVGWLGAQPRPDAGLALAVSVADVGWVVVTTLYLVVRSPPAAGAIAVALTDVAVLALAALQLAGLERSFRAQSGAPGVHRICLDVDSEADADAQWRAIADLGGISRYMTSLRRSSLRDGVRPGVGAVRECENVAGQRWAERCTAWRPDARSFDVVFLAEEPGFPYPFRAMRGGWAVAPRGAGSVVRVWWETTPRHRWLTPLLLPLMAARVRRDFPVIVDAMARGDREATAEAARTPRLAALC